MGETPGLPHMGSPGSPVCSMLLLSMFCTFMPNTLLEIRTSAEVAHEILSHQKVHRDFPRRMAGSTGWFQNLLNRCYQTSARKLSCILWQQFKLLRDVKPVRISASGSYRLPLCFVSLYDKEKRRIKVTLKTQRTSGVSGKQPRVRLGTA